MKNQWVMEELKEKDLRIIDGGSIPAITLKLPMLINLGIIAWLSK